MTPKAAVTSIYHRQTSTQGMSETTKVIMADLQVRLQYKQSDADDWTKVEDKALRKKIQNRLAKRKSSKLYSWIDPDSS